MSSRNRREPNLNRSRQCPRCKKILPVNFTHELLKCSRCKNYRYKEIGVCRVCDLVICERCVDEYSEIQEEILKFGTRQSETKYSPVYICLSALVLILSGALCYKMLSREVPVQFLTPRDLRSYFPSQTTDTWNHIFSILDSKFPTVKSLIILHGKDDKTTECFVNKLIMVYTKNNNIKIKDISFKTLSDEVQDYGEVLEYYRPIIEKHKIFVTDLNKIPGNFARIFHSFCDEGSSPIKPSLFIFVLRYNESVKHLKPSKRATTVLQEFWQDLPSHELFPLLSRVIKNVIDVIPEKHVKC